MLSRFWTLGVLTALACVASAEPAEAFGRRSVACHPVPVYDPCCYYHVDACCPNWHCWCWHPNENALIPPPAHPVPHGPDQHKLTFHNSSTSHEAFVIVYVRHHDGVYREYEKKFLLAGENWTTGQPYFGKDELFIETWLREKSSHHWHCRRCHEFITLRGLSSQFDVVHCKYTHP